MVEIGENLNKIMLNLRVVTLPGVRPPVELIADYKSAYAMWKSVWGETFKELDGVDKIYADEFTRQDEIICIFQGRTCLAMGVMRWTNYDLPTVREDSYFRMWPDDALEKLGSHGSQVVICSNLTVHPMGRSNKLGLPLKDVMVGLLVERLLESGANAMTGTMRADRGMHKTTFQFGATLLAPNLIHHNVPVDLVAFYPENMAPSHDRNVAAAVSYLWNFRRTQVLPKARYSAA